MSSTPSSTRPTRHDKRRDAGAFADHLRRNPERFRAIDDQVRRQREAGRLVMTGDALFFWIFYNRDVELRRWVCAQLDERLAQRGLHYTSLGWLPEGQIDIGPGHETGLRIVGRVGDRETRSEVDRVAVAAYGPSSPGVAGDEWRLAVPPMERQPVTQEPAPVQIARPRGWDRGAS